MTCAKLPKEVQEAADAAERRKDEALERLIHRADDVPPADPYIKALEALIDADKKALAARSRKTP